MALSNCLGGKHVGDGASSMAWNIRMGNPAGTEEDYRGQSATTSGAGQRMEGPAAFAVALLALATLEEGCGV